MRNRARSSGQENWLRGKIQKPYDVKPGSPIRTWSEMLEPERQAIKERLGAILK